MRGRVWGMAVMLGALAALLGAGPAAAAAGVSGHVVDSANQPLAGVEVCAHAPGYVRPSGGCTQTDSSGDYSIPGAVAGDIVQFLSAENSPSAYAPQWWPGVRFSEEAQQVSEADVGQVDATMGPGAAVIGRVVSRATSLPIEGVQVCPEPVIFNEGQGHVCPHTDADGEFALYGLMEAEYWIELRTEHDVNFVEARPGPIPTHAGGTIDLEASLVPGFEIEGTVTEAGTGKPVGEVLPLPRNGTMVCAVDAVTEARVKCTGVEDDGSYSIPGIPPGRSVGVTFGVDYIAEGFDLGMDGYVRRYWDEVPTWGEAAFISGSGGSKFSGIDAALTQGEEVFPRCEVKSACPTLAPPTTVVSPPAIPVAPVASEANPPKADPASPTPVRLPAVRCKTGFRRLVGSSAKACVKVDPGYKRKKKHRRPAHPRRHTPAHR